jgi:ribosomal-protein-alanine N-acetyltransferase
MPKPPFSLRPVRPADPPALARLHAAAFPKGWTAEALAGLLVTSCGFVACAPTGEPLGFLLWQQAGEDADLLTLAVAPAHRRCGIARTLVVEMLAALTLAGVRRVFLEVAKGNAAACALYKELGFETVGLRRNYYSDQPPESRDAWTLMWALGPEN